MVTYLQREYLKCKLLLLLQGALDWICVSPPIHEVGALMNGINALIKEAWESSLAPSTMRAYS